MRIPPPKYLVVYFKFNQDIHMTFKTSDETEALRKAKEWTRSGQHPVFIYEAVLVEQAGEPISLKWEEALSTEVFDA